MLRMPCRRIAPRPHAVYAAPCRARAIKLTPPAPRYPPHTVAHPCWGRNGVCQFMIFKEYNAKRDHSH
ncbi:hypothetical protein Defa_26850 [Desulfovibrio sp. TH_2024_36128]|uniref:Uncharacterized protein n=1 Tax=Desulfovibrio falkowii TaxID=3136602 RepID=A0ABQ0EBS6_9BACT